jgi:hypothetical protein
LFTAALERLPDIAVTHLINLLFEPVLAALVLDVPFLLLLLVPVVSELFFTANAEVTRPPLVDAVNRDTAVAIASMANDVVITLFLYIGLMIWLFIKNSLLNKVSHTNTHHALHKHKTEPTTSLLMHIINKITLLTLLY